MAVNLVERGQRAGRVEEDEEEGDEDRGRYLAGNRRPAAISEATRVLVLVHVHEHVHRVIHIAGPCGTDIVLPQPPILLDPCPTGEGENWELTLSTA
ncbi:unnamed protein product [Lota lota]